MSLRNILVTGANKGIGEAIVRKLLSEHQNTFVILGSRNYDNGLSAKTRILHDIPSSKGRLDVLTLDVSDDECVQNACKEAQVKYSSLFGIVNNAGLGFTEDYKDVVNVNFLGIKRVFDNFQHLLEDGGKVVNVTSGAGPMFVAQMEDGTSRSALVSRDVSWQQLEDIMNNYFSARDNNTNAEHCFGDLSKVYHFSKALANAYNTLIAREHPRLVINACTPGFIATDMTRSHWESSGKQPEDIGCKPVECGAFAPCHLLFQVSGVSGRYFGSDALRSPLHKYRGPGEEEYLSDNEAS